jgi:DNA-binding transcriptional LysR family regulator
MFMMWLLFGGQRINIPTRMIMGQISIELMPAENSVDRLQELRAFISVAEAGGFSAASRRSGEAQPAISKAIASLEKRLGVALFNRSTRSVTLTDQGQRYLDRTKPLLEELAYADNAR